jgi:exosortase/archaeosortase family protein
MGDVFDTWVRRSAVFHLAFTQRAHTQSMQNTRGMATEAQANIHRTALWRSVLVFALVTALLQYGWKQAKDTAFERAVIDVATVQTSAALIRRLTPEVQAQAVGSRIRAPGGGINILNGCEGTEALFLLFAAMAAHQATWRQRALGLLAGTVVVFGLNQLRVLALFYSYRSDRALFDQLHGLVTPLLLICAAVALFAVWADWVRRDAAQARAGEVPL